MNIKKINLGHYIIKLNVLINGVRRMAFSKKTWKKILQKPSKTGPGGLLIDAALPVENPDRPNFQEGFLFGNSRWKVRLVGNMINL